METKASSRRTATEDAVTEDVMTVTTVTEETADVRRSPRLLTQEKESSSRRLLKLKPLLRTYRKLQKLTNSNIA